MGNYRLDKYLTDMQYGTRSQVKDMIRKGRIRINENTAKKPEEKVDPSKDHVFVDGEPVCYEELVYFMLHKPAGVISATEDKYKKTVMDLLPKTRRDLFPVGRLDIDTEGLLLLTNDGALAHRLLSPKKHVDKVYYAETSSAIPGIAKERFKEGICLEDGTKTRPAELCLLSETTARLTIHEGKFHQVKRMFEAVGTSVVYLKRLSMSSLVLDPSLKKGECRKLTEEELSALMSGISEEE